MKLIDTDVPSIFITNLREFSFSWHQATFIFLLFSRVARWDALWRRELTEKLLSLFTIVDVDNDWSGGEYLSSRSTNGLVALIAARDDGSGTGHTQYQALSDDGYSDYCSLRTRTKMTTSLPFLAQAFIAWGFVRDNPQTTQLSNYPTSRLTIPIPCAVFLPSLVNTRSL
jgi:hypothetical protein